MYTKDQLKNRIIWLFRERRAGSTWMNVFLRQVLEKNFYFFDFTEPADSATFIPFSDPDRSVKIVNFFKNRKQHIDDHNFLLDTHEFLALEGINNYKNPILFRIARKDKTEQFLSNEIAIRTRTINVYNNEQIKNLDKIEPFIVSQDSANRFVIGSKQREKLWQDHASAHENETFYYEDLMQGYASKLLDMNLNMNTALAQEDAFLPKKLPFDKKEIIINYAEIESIIKDAFGDHSSVGRANA